MLGSLPYSCGIATKLFSLPTRLVASSFLFIQAYWFNWLNTFSSIATIGVDFKVKVIERKGRRWKLSIWVSCTFRLAIGLRLIWYQIIGHSRTRTIPNPHFFILSRSSRSHFRWVQKLSFVGIYECLLPTTGNSLWYHRSRYVWVFSFLDFGVGYFRWHGGWLKRSRANDRRK